MISVIIPVYNGEATLEACLDSILAQSFSDFEVIVSDNLSTDSTAEIIKRYTLKDNRITGIFCDVAGVSSARNAGIDAARGEFVFFVDSDDTVFPNALEHLHAESAGRDIVIPNVMLVYEGFSAPMDPQTGKVCGEGGDVLKLFAEKLITYVTHPVFKLYRTALLRENNIRFNPELSLGEDMLFNIDAFSHAESVCFSGEILYTYYKQKNGLNSKHRDDFIEIKSMLHNRIKEFLTKRGLWKDRHYLLLMNDVFSMVKNDPTRRGIKKVFASDCCRELSASNVQKYLSFKKRAVLFCIRHRLILPLKIAARLY